jgi:hypothetical protein
MSQSECEVVSLSSHRAEKNTKSEESGVGVEKKQRVKTEERGVGDSALKEKKKKKDGREKTKRNREKSRKTKERQREVA